MSFLSLLTVASVLAASYNVPYGFEVLAMASGTAGVFFYIVMGQILVGLRTSALNPNTDVFPMLAVWAVQAVGVMTVFLGPYSALAIFLFPWILMTSFTNIMLLLVKYQVIEMRDRDDE